jgi:hypothetical protein
VLRLASGRCPCLNHRVLARENNLACTVASCMEEEEELKSLRANFLYLVLQPTPSSDLPSVAPSPASAWPSPSIIFVVRFRKSVSVELFGGSLCSALARHIVLCLLANLLPRSGSRTWSWPSPWLTASAPSASQLTTLYLFQVNHMHHTPHTSMITTSSFPPWT